MSKTKDFFIYLKGRFEGVIKCPCGNEDWQEFLYVTDPSKGIKAICKRCGDFQTFEQEATE